jgi:predicted O-methyltransferase YrrM
MEYEKILNYINSLNLCNSSLSEYYKEIISFQEKYFIPAISLEVGIFLKWLCSLKQPDNLLEIGFGSGVSSVFINLGLNRASNFISLERDKNRYERGVKLLEHFKIASIKLIKIDAFDFFKNNDMMFDFIFLDAVKSEYNLYLEPIKKILNKNGILICDNILFGKRVIKENKVNEVNNINNNEKIDENIDKKYKNGIKKVDLFNNKLINDEKFNTIFLPIGDGISISIKK